MPEPCTPEPSTLEFPAPDFPAPEFRTLEVGARDIGTVRLRCAMAGAGPLVLMVHGFPESWYSWRHQIRPIAEAGFTACAIDVRGYGGSDSPFPVACYDMEALVGDIAGVTRALSPDRPAVLIGHDWGAPIVWNSALAHPQLFCAVAGLSVPYLGVPPRSFDDVMDEMFTRRGRFFYQVYFQERRAEIDLDADPRGFLRRFLYAISGDAPVGSWPTGKTPADRLTDGLIDPDPFPAWLSPRDLDVYVAQFERSGFRGGLNRYRNHTRDFEWLRAFRDRRIEQPSLMIAGDCDPAYTMLGGADPIPVMRRFAPNLQGVHILPGCGHWTQQERPYEVTQALLLWLSGLGLAGAPVQAPFSQIR